MISEFTKGVRRQEPDDPQNWLVSVEPTTGKKQFSKAVYASVNSPLWEEVTNAEKEAYELEQQQLLQPSDQAE